MHINVRKILLAARNLQKSIVEISGRILPRPLAWLFSSAIDRQFYLASLAAKYSRDEALLDHHIMYESYNGRDFSGNPYALLLYLLDHPGFKSFTHVIVSPRPGHPKLSKVKKNPKVIIVKPNSRQYVKYAQSCRYFINNSSWRPYLVKRKGQIYIYTWHSTLLKKLALDKDAVWESKNVSRALLCADFFISPNRFTTELLLDSHCVRSLISARIAEFGYPRNDLIFKTEKKHIRKSLDVPDGKKLLVFAPTWRGEYSPVNNIRETIGYFRELLDLVSDNFHVVVKFHTMVYRFLDRNTLVYCPPLSMDTNELLAAADLLVTDYSGIFYDYLITGNSVVFFTPDRDSYAKAKNGFYIDLEELPGPVAETVQETAALIADISSVREKYSARYEEFRRKFVNDDDGHACERTVALVFRDKEDERVYRITDEREKILLYPGSLSPGESTAAILSFIDSADYSRYSVTVFLKDHLKNRDVQQRISRKANVFYQEAYDSLTYREYAGAETDIPRDAYRRTMKRVFGSTEFDTLIYFHSPSHAPSGALSFFYGFEKVRKIVFLNNFTENSYTETIQVYNDLFGFDRQCRIEYVNNLQGLAELL